MEKKQRVKRGIKVKESERGFSFHKFRYAIAHRDFLDYSPEYIRKLKRDDPEAYEFLKRFVNNTLTNFWFKDGRDFYYHNDKDRKTIQNEVYHRRVDVYGLQRLAGYFIPLDAPMSEESGGSTWHEAVSAGGALNLEEDAMIAALDAGRRERD